MTMRFDVLRAVAVLVVALLWSAQLEAQTPSVAGPGAGRSAAATDGGSGAPVADDTASQTYILGPADVIEVSVLGRPDFTTKGRIGEDGTIRVPFLGSVAAANRTTGKLSDELAAALQAGGYFSHPIVKVDVASYASRYVTVLGNVGNPGLVTVDRAYRLSEIIARVGGIRETGADYVVFRPKLGEERRISIQSLATGDLKDDPYVSPGDKIYSPEAEVFYVSGQIKQPGAYPLKKNLTFRMAVSRGGGITDSGSLKSIAVTRAGKKLGHVDLDAIVMPGDVIVVGERLF
jgi:polysaccharide export outer membrane protein